MKRLQIIFALCITIALFTLHYCGGNVYSEAIKLNTQYVKLMETYLDNLNAADNAKEVANAMNTYADGLEKIWPRMKAFSDAHPELKNKDNQPDDLKASNKKAEELGRKMGSAFSKVIPYMEDANVQKAQERIAEIMR